MAKTGKGKITAISRNYQDSPISKILSQLLEKISQLRQKYPKTKADAIDKLHADKMVNFVDTLLTKLHADLLPQFSLYKKPGLPSIFMDVLGLKDLKKELLTRKYILFLDIKKLLPNIIRNAPKIPKNVFSKSVYLALTQEKDTLFKNASAIAGESLEVLFEELFDEFENTLTANCDFSDEKEIQTMLRLFERKVFPSGEGINALTISHPMTYELAEYMILLCEPLLNMPLQDLMPFLNPEAFVADLHNDMTGYLIGLATRGRTFVSERVQESGVEEPSYIYNVTTHTAKGAVVDNYNIQALFQAQMEWNITDLLIEMKGYAYIYAETAHANSELARTSLLQNFTNDETVRLCQLVNNHKKACKLEVTFKQTDLLEKIFAIDTELQREQSLLKKNSHLQTQLITRNAAYGSAPVSDLVNLYPHLIETLNGDYEQGLDITYSFELLPEQLAGVPTDKKYFMIIKVKTELEAVIEEQMSVLQKYNLRIERKLNELAKQRQHAIKAWKQTMLRKGTRNAENHLNLLEIFQQDLAEIDSNSHVVVYDDITSLEQAIVSCEKQSAQRELLVKQIPGVKDIERLYQLPMVAVRLDEDHALQSALSSIGLPVLQVLHALLKQITTQQQQQAMTLFNLQSHLEKARAEAVFLENMRTLNPVKIGELCVIAKEESTKIGNKKTAVSEQIKSLEAQISANKTRHKTSLSEQHEMHEAVLKFDENNSLLLSSVLVFCADNFLLKNDWPQVSNLITNERLVDEFFDGVTSEIKQRLATYAKNPYTPDYYNKCINLFAKILECMNSRKDAMIPFNAIEGLPCVKQWNSKNSLNFNDILALLGQQSAIESWRDFRARQDDLVHMLNRPANSEFSQKFYSLTESLVIKLRELTAHLQQLEAAEMLSKRLVSFRVKLNTIKGQVTDNFTGKSGLCGLVELGKQQSEGLISSIAMLELKNEQQHQALQLLECDQQKQEQAASVLAGIIEILEGVNACKLQMESFANSGEHVCTSKELYQTLVDLQHVYDRLVSKAQKISLASLLLPNADAYNANLDFVKNLLLTIKQNIASTLRIKLNLNPLELQIEALEDDFSKLAIKQTLLINKMNPKNNSVTMVEITAFLTRLSEISESLVAQHTVIETVSQGLSRIEDVEYRSKIEKIQASKNVLKRRITDCGQWLMDTALEQLTQCELAAQIFKNTAGAEHVKNQASNAVTLALTNKRLELLPDDETFKRLALTIDRCAGASKTVAKFEAIKLARKNTLAQLQSSEASNMRVLQRITERSNLVDNVLLPKLDAYLRARQSAYKIKDIFSSTDKTNRELLVHTLELQLKEYRNSGDSQPVLKTIKDNIANVPGFYLQALLQKVSIELIDFDQKIPLDYQNENTLLSRKQADVLARATLGAMQQTYPEYVRAIGDLYNQVLAMKQLEPDDEPCAVNFKLLAARLKYDLDGFVAAHPFGLPGKHAYEQLRDNFTLRLHSEDDLHGMHPAVWKPFVLNVLIGLATLGIAIGLKALHSKISTGRCTLFFNETKRQQHIALLDEMMSAPILAGAA